MNALLCPPSAAAGRPSARLRSAASILATIDVLTRDSASLTASELGPFEVEGAAYTLPRLLYLGPQGGDAPLRLGLFASIHGDEPAGTYALLRLARLLE